MVKMVIVTSKTPKLDLHGEITSMVKVLVDDFIKEQYLMRKSVVRIVHGKSTNILTKEVHQVLKQNNMVDNFYLNSWNLGETIVILKNASSFY